MSINDIPPNELFDHRKLVSDKKDDNPELSIAESSSKNPRSRAYMKIRNLKSALELNKTVASFDDEVYFNELMKDG